MGKESSDRTGADRIGSRRIRFDSIASRLHLQRQLSTHTTGQSTTNHLIARIMWRYLTRNDCRNNPEWLHKQPGVIAETTPGGCIKNPGWLHKQPRLIAEKPRVVAETTRGCFPTGRDRDTSFRISTQCSAYMHILNSLCWQPRQPNSKELECVP